MPNPRRSLARARKELKTLLRNPPPVTDLPEPGYRWHRLYTQRICRYLLDHLDDEEMMDWEIAFTGLHEMVGCAWGWRPADAEGLGDVEAWAQFSVERHLTIAHVSTLMPDWVDVMLLVPHMRGFVRFLHRDGAIRDEDAERLDHEYAMFDPTEAPRAVA